MSATATRLLQNYVAGRWTPARAATEVLDVTNPATGAMLARVPLSGAADLDDAVAAARAALPRVARGVDDRPGPQAVRAARAAGGAQRRHGPVGDGRDGQDDRRRAGRGGPRDRDGRGGVRDPDDDAGPHPRGRQPQHRRRDDPPAGRGVRGDRPVQLPRDGAVLVSALRDRVRQHVRAQALRAGAADPADRLRGTGCAGAAAGRGQSRQRRPRDRRGHPRPPGDRRRLVRRLGAGGAAGLRARGQGRQARAGAGRGQEPHGGHARRGDGQDRRRDPRLGVRRRRAALHGRVGGGHRRRRA